MTGETTPRRKVVALCGGGGGAKLALGLAQVVPSDDLLLVANTGDDFDHFGLRICPDLDTLTYSLAGCLNPATGWGRADETSACMDALASLGAETWFFLGDRDLALHLERTRRLAGGESLSAVTRALSARWGVTVPLIPMSDDPVATLVETAAGALAFQHYFVRDRCQPVVTGFRFAGIDSARAHPQLLAALADDELGLVVLGPSNPYVSIDPILALPGVRAALRNTKAPVIAVSPIVGGTAVKGPTAKMMAELGRPVSALTVACHYRDILDGFMLDRRDAHEAAAVAAMVPAVRLAQTLMQSLADRVDVARDLLAFAAECAQAAG